MSQDSPFDGRIKTAEAFEAALGQLLESATENGIDPEGSWEYRVENPGRDWEILVIELEKQVGSD